MASKQGPSPRGIAVGLLVMLCGVMTVRGDIEFLLDGTTPSLADGLNNGDRVTVGDLTLTFSNLVTSNGGSTGDLDLDVGILFSGTTGPTYSDVIRVDITFNEDVEISSYEIGGREDIPAGTFFTLAGIDGVSGQNIIPAISGSTTTEVSLPFVPGALSVLKAGQAYTLSHNLPDNPSLDALFNLEALCVNVKHASFPVDFVPTGGKTGHLDFLAEYGYRYSLQRSLTLGSSVETDMVNGGGAPESFLFDDSASGFASAFYSVKRVPSVPDTFGAGNTVDLTLPERDNELVRQTGVSGGTLQVVVHPTESNITLLEGATYVYTKNPGSGVTTLDATLPQGILSDAQILSLLDAEYVVVNSDFRMAVDNLGVSPTEAQGEAVVDAVINRFTGFFIDQDENNRFFILRNSLLTLDANREGTLRFAGPGIILTAAGAPFVIDGAERSYDDLVIGRFR